MCLALGIDLGTSGVRIAILNQENELIFSDSEKYQTGLEASEDWISCCITLIKAIPIKLKNALKAISVAGTSGTLIAVDYDGKALGKALPYYLSFPEFSKQLLHLVQDNNSTSVENSSLGRALKLLSLHGPEILVRHQADWISGWLIDNWKWGEEGNNFRLGWNPENRSWPSFYEKLSCYKSLPEIIESGVILNKICPNIAHHLHLPKDLVIVSGTTDSNAAVLAANPLPEDGVTILGSTIVLKRFTKEPLKAAGITNHKVGGRWLCGGSSNCGGAALTKIFSKSQLKELSNQINPNQITEFNFLPLQGKGERFPVNNPNLEPILEPRPLSDSLYLHGLLESLAKIEAQGWDKLTQLGSSMPKRIITLGGGAKNPQWRKIRERVIGVPIRTSLIPPAAGAARLALNAIK